MVKKSRIIWSLKELTGLLRERQLNKFDCNFGVSGKRGDGKSTLLFKIFHSFRKEGFRQKTHQVYSQDDVGKLLATQKFSYCWDDEAINSGYKRDFQNKGQKNLIKIVTNYRDNFNIYGSALPFFYSLDRDLRELIFMHIHIVERGVAVILLPVANQIHSQDPWDTRTNMKIEEKENKRLERNPNAIFRYHRLTTFAGYLYFGKMTDKQEKLYKEIKERKRERQFKMEQDQKEYTFMERVYKLLTERKLTRDGLSQICLSNDKKYSNIISLLNKMLKDNGVGKTTTHFIRKDISPPINSNFKTSINDLVPPPPL